MYLGCECSATAAGRVRALHHRHQRTSPHFAWFCANARSLKFDLFSAHGIMQLWVDPSCFRILCTKSYVLCTMYASFATDGFPRRRVSLVLCSPCVGTRSCWRCAGPSSRTPPRTSRCGTRWTTSRQACAPLWSHLVDDAVL